MKIYQGIRNAVLAAILSAFGTSAGAQLCNPQVQECERIDPITLRNDPITLAQELKLGGVGSVITVNGMLGRRMDCVAPFPIPPLPGCLDVDFYYFDAREGTVLNVDVANTVGRITGLNTALTILGPGKTYEMLRENADIVGFRDDPNKDNWNFNSRILAFRASGPGTVRYTIGVSTLTTILTGGIYRGTQVGSTSVGEYILKVEVVSLGARQINIDIKPGSGDTPPINPKSKGNIPVALLGSATFNPFDAYPDPKSLTFGATGDEESYLRCAKDGVDVNNDGFLDRVCHFDTQAAKFHEDHLEGTLKGKTKDGNAFEGRGRLKVRPAKTEVE